MLNNYFISKRQQMSDFIFPEGAERRAQLLRDIDTDALTGVANLRALDRALPAAERDPDTTVILFDLDNFGQVNKLRGHTAGDWLLRELASVCSTVALVYGVGARVFRKGGDEFVILCATVDAAAIRSDVERLFGDHRIVALEGGGRGVFVTVSGTCAATFAEADSVLQSRKARRKARAA